MALVLGVPPSNIHSSAPRTDAQALAVNKEGCLRHAAEKFRRASGGTWSRAHKTGNCSEFGRTLPTILFTRVHTRDSRQLPISLSAVAPTLRLESDSPALPCPMLSCSVAVGLFPRLSAGGRNDARKKLPRSRAAVPISQS